MMGRREEMGEGKERGEVRGTSKREGDKGEEEEGGMMRGRRKREG